MYWQQRGNLDEWWLYRNRNPISRGRVIKREGAYFYQPRDGATAYNPYKAVRLEGITTLEDAQAAATVLLSLKQTGSEG